MKRDFDRNNETLNDAQTDLDKKPFHRKISLKTDLITGGFAKTAHRQT
jgi:hypothetical protein